MIERCRQLVATAAARGACAVVRCQVAIGLAILLAVFAACDPGFTMHGDVVDVAGRPIPDVRVVLTCYGVDQQATQTDSNGRFSDHRVGVFGQECAVEIRPAGHKALSFPVLANCSRFYSKDKCAEVTVHARVR